MASGLILVVEDERNIRELVRVALETHGYRVITAADGEQALVQARQTPPDLVVLDLMLPKLDGWDVTRHLRATSDVPIIMLTARREESDRVAGLELGADDYVPKPFSPRELVARIGAVLRRSRGNQRPRVASFGPIRLDQQTRRVTVNDQPVLLRPREFDLLAMLLSAPDVVFTRNQLLTEIWGFDGAESTRTVDVHASQLRARLEGSGVTIESVRGVGYRLARVGG